MTSLSDKIREKALELGFTKAGIVRAGALDMEGERLSGWLGREFHGQMTWMVREPEKRSDPRALLPGCRSVVVAAMNYWPGEAEAAPRPGRGKVALYARGRDYHRVLGEKLKALATWLDAEAGSTSRAFVDTGPVLERAWAERAGIGWIGKNANLLTRDRGSWLLLGEILTTAKLTPDAGPHAEFCGTCTACLDACPTGAIESPGVVDAHRCISYWTIEHRGDIPEAMRPAIGDWIFGCDLCLEVCPWNRFAKAGREARFAAREDRAAPALEPLLELDDAGFRRKFNGSPIQRATRDGFVRNVCVALGNVGGESSRAALARAASNDSSEVVRAHARWGLEQIELRNGG